MLKKMLIHGLIAAAVIGGAAAVYASGRGDGYAMEDAAQGMRADARYPAAANNGYIADSGEYKERKHSFGGEREHEREHEYRGERSEHRRNHGDRDDD